MWSQRSMLWVLIAAATVAVGGYGIGLLVVGRWYHMPWYAATGGDLHLANLNTNFRLALERTVPVACGCTGAIVGAIAGAAAVLVSERASAAKSLGTPKQAEPSYVPSDLNKNNES